MIYSFQPCFSSDAAQTLFYYSPSVQRLACAAAASAGASWLEVEALDVTLKDVKKRWGHGQEDVFPVAQFDKLWGDMTALPSEVGLLRQRRALKEDAAAKA